MAKILRGDPSLSGQIIKYANSAAAGNRKSVATINDALVRLGMRMVRQLCLGFSVLSNSKGGHCENFDYGKFWAHSLAMATSCQTLATVMGSINPDEGFTCGLLAEIGGLALASVYPEKYARVLEQWDGGNRTHLLQIEQEELSITRNQVTASLFEDWGLPAFYPLAVLNKDDTGWANLGDSQSAADAYAKLANLLFAGNLAAEICIEKGKERHWRVLDFQNFARLFHLDDTEFVSIYDEILEEWSRMGKVLDVVTGQVPSMADMLRKARNTGGAAKLADGVIDDRHAPAQSLITPIPESELDFEVDEAVGVRILVATDCPLQQKTLTLKLTENGHEVSVAHDGL
jgi:HD-like signal output (HDOD) protein